MAESGKRVLLLTSAAGMPQDVTGDSSASVAVDFAALGLSASAQPFALKVHGQSMVDAHIVDGDVVIMDHRKPRHGDVVAALIDGETTLKRFVIHGGQTYLKAENIAFPDLVPVHELVVQGVMVGLLRSAR